MGGGSARGDGGGTHIDVCISAYDLRIVVFLRRLRYRVDGVIKNGWCSWWWTNICYIARLNGVDFAVAIVVVLCDNTTCPLIRPVLIQVKYLSL